MMQRDERSLGELFSELSHETSTLIRKEVELAKTEISQKASEVGKDIGYVAVGGGIAYVGVIVLAFAGVYLLSLFLPAWLSALIVGLVVAGTGYFLVRKGLERLRQTSLAPERTIQTLKEDTEWAKNQVK